MLNTTERINLKKNTINYSTDTYFLKSKNNKDLLYTSSSKCKSIEYIFDSLIAEKCLVVYDDLDKNKLWIIVTNSEVKTFEFETDTEAYQNEKVEELINVLSFKEGLESVYLIEGSKYKEVLKLDNLFLNEIPRSEFKKMVKNCPLTKTTSRYALTSLLIAILLLGVYYTESNGFNTLKKLEQKEFNSNYSKIEKEILAEKEILDKYDEIKDKRLSVLEKNVFSAMDFQNKPPQDNRSISNNFIKRVRQ